MAKKMKIEIEFVKLLHNRKLITTDFKKDLCEVLEKHFKHEWKNVSYQVTTKG